MRRKNRLLNPRDFVRTKRTNNTVILGKHASKCPHCQRMHRYTLGYRVTPVSIDIKTRLPDIVTEPGMEVQTLCKAILRAANARLWDFCSITCVNKWSAANKHLIVMEMALGEPDRYSFDNFIFPTIQAVWPSLISSYSIPNIALFAPNQYAALKNSGLAPLFSLSNITE